MNDGFPTTPGRTRVRHRGGYSVSAAVVASIIAAIGICGCQKSDDAEHLVSAPAGAGGAIGAPGTNSQPLVPADAPPEAKRQADMAAKNLESVRAGWAEQSKQMYLRAHPQSGPGKQ